MLGRPACVARTEETRSGSRREERRNREVVITSVVEVLVLLTSRLACVFDSLQIVRKRAFKTHVHLMYTLVRDVPKCTSRLQTCFTLLMLGTAVVALVFLSE